MRAQLAHSIPPLVLLKRLFAGFLGLTVLRMFWSLANRVTPGRSPGPVEASAAGSAAGVAGRGRQPP
jgi:hypothetical protein